MTRVSVETTRDSLAMTHDSVETTGGSVKTAGGGGGYEVGGCPKLMHTAGAGSRCSCLSFMIS